MASDPGRRYADRMSLKSRHTRHRAKASVSPRATRPSVRKLNRAKAKPKASKK